MKFEVVTTKAQLEDVFEVRKAVFVKEQEVPLDIEIDEYEHEATHIEVITIQIKPLHVLVFALTRMIPRLK